jgi:hypothetical protein
MKNIELIINEARDSLKDEHYLAALALALTIPDICSEIKSPAKKQGHGKLYSAWVNSHLSCFNSGNGKTGVPDFNGDICWKLRCAFFHSGSDDITLGKAHIQKTLGLEAFHLLVQPSQSTIRVKQIKIPKASQQTGKGYGVLEVNIAGICEDLIGFGEEDFQNNPNGFPELNIQQVKVEVAIP